MGEIRVVTNRVFLLGLDDLYREAIQKHERDELLRCARETASALSVLPADVAIEGYYAENEELAEYFRLVRALQGEPQDRAAELASVEGFRRLKQVTSSPIFGPPSEGQYLLSTGQDAMFAALENTFPDWNISSLTDAAYQCALDADDYSLVALASLSRDPVVLAALRESVVLYAMLMAGCAAGDEPEYVWEVDGLIQSRAVQFVATFNGLFGESLPEPGPENAEVFWHACEEWKVIGRCVRLGFDDRTLPPRHYHWAIEQNSNHELAVKDFWDTEVWTTERFRSESQVRL
jgi:hypothetical protein